MSVISSSPKGTLAWIFRWVGYHKYDLVAGFANLFALVIVAISGTVLIIGLLGGAELIKGAREITDDQQWTFIIMVLIAFAYDYGTAYGSMRMLVNRGPWVSGLVRMNIWAYFLGTMFVYAILIWKLSEQDHGWVRYIQFVIIILVCIVASVLMGNLTARPQIDVSIYAGLVLFMNLVHFLAIVVQYAVLLDFVDIWYFAQQIGVLLTVAILSGLILNRKWNPKYTRRLPSP